MERVDSPIARDLKRANRRQRRQSEKDCEHGSRIADGAVARERAMSDERRKSSRHKSFLHGCIYFNNRRSAIDCLIRDISPEGAKLVFSQTASIPDVIDLYIPQKDQMLRAHVQRRTSGEVGVTFDTAQPLVATVEHDDLGARVDQLEAQVAALRRIVKRLRADIDIDAA
jgi:PilZ domain